MRPDRTIRGFTLVELCSVLVIAGVLMAIAGPKFLDTPAFDQRGYTDELAAAIRSAEIAAAASGCAVKLTITPGIGYDAELPDLAATCAGGYGAVPVLRLDGTALRDSPPRNADVATAAVLLFDPKGPVSGPTIISVVGSPTRATQALTLQIDPLSGFVTGP